MLKRIFEPFPVLTTEKLTLRQLAISDKQEIFVLRSDRAINRYLDRQASHTADDAADFIRKVNENIGKKNALYWAITINGREKLVGTICLFSFSDDNDTCEIGYELLTNFQGQGIMSEAAAKVIEYAFNTIKVRQIEASLHGENERSKKLLEKFSFRRSDKSDAANPELIFFHLKDPAKNNAEAPLERKANR